MRKKFAALIAAFALALGMGTLAASPAQAAVVEYGHTAVVVVDTACDWDLQVKWVRDGSLVEPRGIRIKQHSVGCLTKTAGSTAFLFVNHSNGFIVGNDSTNCNMPVGISVVNWTECTFSGAGTPYLNAADAEMIIDFYKNDNLGGGTNGMHEVSSYRYL